MRVSPLLTAATLTLGLTSAHAATNVEINSFLTIGMATSSLDDGIYLNTIDDNLTFVNDSKYGMNFRTQTSDKLSGAAQLLGAGRNDNFKVEVEWAYVNYDFSDSINMRVGKLNLQTFLLSDYIEVGYLYPWIRPPEEVYNFVPFRNFPGAEIMHTARLGKGTQLTSQLFIGSAETQINSYTKFAGVNGVGLNFQLDGPSYTIRLGAISPVVKIEMEPHVDSTGTAVPGSTIDFGDRAYLYTFGISWDINNFIGYSEFVTSETDGNTQGAFPNQDGYYLTLGYQMGRTLPFITVAGTDGEAPAPAPFAAQPVIQDSVAFGLRYDMNDSMAVKFEYKQIEPDTASSSFNSAPLPAGETDFSVISIAMDIIF